MENIIVTLTNLPCIYPIYISYKNKDYITTTSITYVASASIISHLFENHKHGMPGFGLSQNVSYILNRLDVFGSVLVISRFAYLLYKKYGFNKNIVTQNYKLTFSAIVCAIFLRISEYDKYNTELKNMYIVTHSIWHMGIFTVMGKVLQDLIYLII